MLNLQKGTVVALYNNQRSNPLYRDPVLQIAALNQVTQGDKPRYKANLSDGQFYMRATFSSELSPVIENGTIKPLSLIKVTNFILRTKDEVTFLHVQTIGGYESRDAIVGQPVNIRTGRQSGEASGATENGPSNSPNQKSGAVQVVIKSSPTKQPVNKQAAPETKSSRAEESVTLKPTLKTLPIKELNPFLNNWTIKGRVTFKSDIKTFASARGEGRVFSFELTDETAQVKVTAFSPFTDVFFPLVELNKVYTLSKGTVKMANKKYSSNNFPYEVHLDKNSQLQPIEDDTVPFNYFNFVKASDLSVDTANLIDFIGVVKEVYPVGTVTLKSTGRDLIKRDVLLVDDTGVVRLTLWGAKAEEEYDCDRVLCLKSVKVGEYNGVTLSTVGSSQVISNCDDPAAISLMKWYSERGRNVSVERPRTHSQTKLIGDIKAEYGDFVVVNATVLFVKDDLVFYESCPSEKCNKKVSKEEGGYRCEKCNYVYENCNLRYLFNMRVGDFSGQIWVSFFDEVGQSLFGISAEEFKILRDGNPAETQGLVRSKIGQEHTMRLRMKEEMYNGEPRMRFTCMGMQLFDPEQATIQMLGAISLCQ